LPSGKHGAVTCTETCTIARPVVVITTSGILLTSLVGEQTVALAGAAAAKTPAEASSRPARTLDRIDLEFMKASPFRSDLVSGSART
jgi:hypothetical protein